MNFFAVTKSDTVGFSYIARALYVGTTGDVAVVGLDGVAVTFTAVPAGALLPVMCIRVNSANTSASNIVGLY
jgi:hypothetical protein